MRFHLDTLPAVFHFDGPGDQFLAESAFPFARWRYACADSLLGSGVGGTVVGALARSLFDDGLLWQWIAESAAERRPALLGSMLEERDRICGYLDDHEVSCPNLARWFVPLDGVTDLTGTSLAALAAPSLPDTAELLDLFLASSPTRLAAPALIGGGVEALLQAARGMLAMSGLRGAVMVLGHAGHGNLLGLQSSVAAGGVPGHDLRADHEALFMHVAAVGVTVTLLGVCAAVPECWPPEVEQGGFLGTLIQLTEDVVAAASAIHGLGDPKPAAAPPKIRAKQPKRRLRPEAVVAHHDLLPDIAHAGLVVTAVREYDSFVNSWITSPWAHGDPKLASVLAYAGAHATFSAVMSTFEDHAAVASVFAARMLLEEAARFTWLVQDPEDEEAFVQRSTRYFDEFRARKKKTIALFASNGVALAAATRLFRLPDSVIEGPESISKGRRPLPSIDEMLLLMGAPYPEPGWLPVAYSLLSQVTHSTPIGLVHMARYRDGVLSAHDISPEMLALALDVACLGSARLLGMSSLMLTQGSDEARQYALGLEERALAVHDKARLVHWLD